MDGDFYMGAMSSSWVAPSGNFDVDCYEVSIFRNDEQAPLIMFNTTSTFMTATYSGTVMDTAYARIVIISRCGVRSLPFDTNRVSPLLSGSKSDVYRDTHPCILHCSGGYAYLPTYNRVPTAI